jgi:hypothetical protein
MILAEPVTIDLTSLPGIITASILLISGAAGALGFFRATLAKARIEALNGELEEQGRRYNGLKEDLATEKHDREETDNQLTVAKARIKILEEALSGKKEFAEIASVLRTHDQRAQNIERLIIAVAEKEGVLPRE